MTKRRLTLAEQEREFFERALRTAKGCKTKAAKILGVSYRTVLRKFKNWALEDQRDRKTSKSDKLSHTTDSKP